jgi:hypothetical protein
VLGKVVAHNLCVLIQAFFYLGLDLPSTPCPRKRSNSSRDRQAESTCSCDTLDGTPLRGRYAQGMASRVGQRRQSTWRLWWVAALVPAVFLGWRAWWQATYMWHESVVAAVIGNVVLLAILCVPSFLAGLLFQRRRDGSDG